MISHADRYWFALRGAQQLDLATRFDEATRARGLHLLALKGVAIAEELYGGFENRPMADIDFLVVETSRFREAVATARSLGLVETDASDHALVFKEPASGVVLELHLSLIACPGLFPVDPASLWSRRKSVTGGGGFRLADEDFIVHLALHTAFQHGFAANVYHYGDFTRALHAWRSSASSLETRSREWGAAAALGAMSVASLRLGTVESAARPVLESLTRLCPRPLASWITSEEDFPPSMRLTTLAFVRYHLAPSTWRFLTRTLLPRPLPGRTLPRVAPLRRVASLVETGFRGALGKGRR